MGTFPPKVEFDTKKVHASYCHDEEKPLLKAQKCAVEFSSLRFATPRLYTMVVPLREHEKES